MTIKVYKKRVRWYFTFHGEEIYIEQDNFLNILEKLLNKNVLYFKVNFGGKTYTELYFWLSNWESCYYPSETISSLIRLFKEPVERIKMPKSIIKECPDWIFIEDVK